MTKEQIAAIGGVPEVLDGLEIDWLKYTPTGGVDFQIMRVGTKSDLAIKRKACFDLVEEVNRKKLFSSKMKSAADGFLCLTQLAANADAVEVVGSEIANRLSDTAAFAAEICDRANDYVPSTDAIESLDKDVLFIDSLNCFFDSDLALDMILYAIDFAPAKYRMKLFRTAMKHLQNCEISIARVDTSESKIKDGIMDEIGEDYEMLKSIYGELGKGLRRMRKEIDRVGPSFWDKYSSDMNVIKTLTGK